MSRTEETLTTKEERAMTRRISSIATIAALFLGIAFAQNEAPLTRDEVASIKKKIVGVLDALGQPPAGYSSEKESFHLPTDAYKVHESGLFYPMHASVDRTYGTEKKAEKSSADFTKEYEKKVAEAQAKGDYQAMTKLVQEMQKKVGEMQLKTIEGRKEPISVRVQTNSDPVATIDPDAAVFERSGIIALKSKSDDSAEKAQISVYFDPVSLKDTKQLSKVNMKLPEKGTSSKTAIFNFTLELQGPAVEVEAWAKKIDTNKVLAQIDKAK